MSLLAWGQPVVLHVKQLPCLEQGLDTSLKDHHCTTTETPVTLIGPAAAADPGEQRFPYIRACTWNRHDKANRNTAVKDMTYCRDKITLLSARICSVVVYAIVGISGLWYFQKSVNIPIVASDSKLFG